MERYNPRFSLGPFNIEKSKDIRIEDRLKQNHTVMENLLIILLGVLSPVWKSSIIQAFYSVCFLTVGHAIGKAEKRELNKKLMKYYVFIGCISILTIIYLSK